MHCYAVLYSVNCPAVICLPACMLLFIYGETPLVNCGPRSFFFKLIKQPTAILLLSFSANKHHFPHIRLILCYSKPVRLTTSLLSWGKVSWLCWSFRTSNLFILLLSCLVYFYYCLVCLISKIQKKLLLALLFLFRFS